MSSRHQNLNHIKVEMDALMREVKSLTDQLKETKRKNQSKYSTTRVGHPKKANTIMPKYVGFLQP